MLEITYPDSADGTTADDPAAVMIVGVEQPLYPKETHRMVGWGRRTEKLELWLDTIEEITDTNDVEAILTMKDGSIHLFKYPGAGYSLLLYDESDGTIRVPLAQVKQVKFLKAAREDELGKAMFDHWKYSPYTGEKLDEEE